jgi:glycosyltransferase involved in cell wall biosynthesis
MRIAFLINGLGRGGAERSLAELLPGLRARGITPSVICLDGGGELEEAVLDAGVEVRRLGGTLAGAAIRLRGWLRRERPALLHTSLFEADVVGRLASVGTGVPVLCSLVNTTYAPVRLQDPNVRAWRLRAVRRIDASTARHLVAHFHAVSRAVKEAAVSDLGIPPERITVVERGRDPARLGAPSPGRRAAARRALGVGEGEVVLLNVGRQEFQKGQEHLLEAVARLVGRYPGLRLFVAGRQGHATGRLQAAVGRLGLGGTVRFLGHRDDVPELLAAADVFVFPSLYEGLGGALIEAMALALPIVASDLPAIREVVEEGRNAVLVPPASPEALAGAIVSVLEGGHRRQAMGARSREIFEERFTLERSVARMVELYERVARR